MPVYEYRAEDGETMELLLPMADEKPTFIERDGKRFDRVYGAAIDAGTLAKVHGYPYASRQLPKNMQGVKCDRRGHPIVRSSRHEKELGARFGALGRD